MAGGTHLAAFSFQLPEKLAWQKLLRQELAFNGNCHAKY